MGKYYAPINNSNADNRGDEFKNNNRNDRIWYIALLLLLVGLSCFPIIACSSDSEQANSPMNIANFVAAASNNQSSLAWVASTGKGYDMSAEKDNANLKK